MIRSDACAVFGAEGRLRVTEIFDSFLDGKKGRLSVFYDSCAVFGAEGRLRVTEIFDSFLDGKKR